jgi:hypothetical protein
MFAVDVLVKTVDCGTQLIADTTSVKMSSSLALDVLDESFLGHECGVTGAVVADHDADGA